MKTFPVTILDDFYECPEIVQHYALSQKFYPNKDGRWPGSRSLLISNLNKELFQTFSEKLFSLFFDLDAVKLSWEIETSFQKINRFSEDKNSKFNEGWIHKDPCIFSGIIYLSKNCSGTNIYEPIDPDDTFCCQKQKNILYSGGKIDEEEYSNGINENNSKFRESVKIEGRFNRLVMFEGGVFHGVPSFYCENDESRLTQVFFINRLDVDGSNYPIIRSRLI